MGCEERGVEAADSATVSLIAVAFSSQQWNGIDLSQYGEYCKKHMSLLGPCFKFQKTLQRKCLGTRFWRRKMKKRVKKFGDSTWTDIYEDLRDVAMDEIKQAEDYRKKRKLR